MPEFEPPVPEYPAPPGRRTRPAAEVRAVRRLPRQVRVGLGIVTVLAAIAATATAARLTRQDEPRPAHATRFDLGAPRSVLDLPGRIVSVDLGAGSGVALARRCAGDRCRSSLAVGTGGRWQRRPLPGAAAVAAAHVPLHVVLLPGGRILVTGRYGGWFTADAGRSWRAVPADPGAPVARTAGSRLVVIPDRGNPKHLCAGGRVGVISRHTGRTAPLRRQPGFAVCWAAAAPDPDGRHWVTGVDPATGTLAAAYRTDGTTAWRVERLAGSGTAAELSWSDSQRYALTLAGRYPARTLVRGLLARHPDGWHEVTRWPDANLLAVRGELVVRRDGSLLAVGGAGEVLTSPGAGSPFHPAGHRLRLGPVTRTGGGWVTQVQDVAYPWLHSTDGFTWRRLPVS